MDDQSDKISRLEDRIEQLEERTKKMMPTRRDALKFGGAAAIGAAAMSGTASAGSSEVGTIGDSNNLVDIEAEDVNVSDSINGASVSGAANGEALTSDGAGGLTFASVGGGVPANFSYVDQSNNRSLNTAFTNNTGKALFVTVTAENNADIKRTGIYVLINGSIIIRNERDILGDYYDGQFNSVFLNFFVPNGATYEVAQFSPMSITNWFEAEM